MSQNTKKAKEKAHSTLSTQWVSFFSRGWKYDTKHFKFDSIESLYAFKCILHTSWQRHTIQTIRYKLYNIAGKVIANTGQTILKVNNQFI